MDPEPSTVQRLEFASSDPAEAREFIDQVYGWRLTHKGTRDSSWQVAMTGVNAGSFTTTDITMPADLTFKIDGQGEVLVCTLAGGDVGIDRGKITGRYQPGDVFISNQPEADWAGHTRDSRIHVLALPQAVLEAAARADPRAKQPRWRMLSFEPVPDGGRQWRAATRFIDDTLANPAAASSPLLIGSAGRLLAATALAVFPNNAFIDPAIEDRHDAHAATLRRAVAFIDEHAHEDITVADIAAAAFVTIRAVQLAFHRHLGTTPLAYLRRIRLHRAHRELLDGDPAHKTVTAVAFRWGFSSSSRFATLYRQAYGVPPNHTLYQH